MGNLDFILKLKNKSIRIIRNIKLKTIKAHFASLNTMTVYGMYIFETIFSVKFIPESLKYIRDNHHYNTRNANIFFNSHRLKLYKKNQLIYV